MPRLTIRVGCSGNEGLSGITLPPVAQPDDAGRQVDYANAFIELALYRLQADIQPGNQRSIAPVRRAGFRKEGP